MYFVDDGINFLVNLQSPNNTGVKVISEIVTYIGYIPFVVFFVPLLYLVNLYNFFFMNEILIFLNKGYEPNFGMRYLNVIMLTVFVCGIFKFIHHDARPYWLSTNVQSFLCDPLFAYPNEQVMITVSVGLWSALQFEVNFFFKKLLFKK